MVLTNEVLLAELLFKLLINFLMLDIFWFSGQSLFQYSHVCLAEIRLINVSLVNECLHFFCGVPP